MQRAASEIRRPLSRQTKAGTYPDYHGPLGRTDGASESAWHRGTPKDFLNTSTSAQAPIAYRQRDVAHVARGRNHGPKRAQVVPVNSGEPYRPR